MRILEFLESTSPDFFDVRVEVGFAQSLTPDDVLGLLQTVTALLQSDTARLLSNGMSYIAVATSMLTVHVRYATTTGLDALFKGREDVSMLRMHFIFYCFAVIDCAYPLDDVPFPADFRVFLELPAYLATARSL